MAPRAAGTDPTGTDPTGTAPPGDGLPPAADPGKPDPAELLFNDGQALVRLLQWSAVGLLVLFVSGVVAGILPLRLLVPAWQLRLSQTLVDYSAIPLVAFALVHLAAFLDPLDERLAARRDALRHAAVLAVFGFLLLIPLQPWALWKGWSQASGAQAVELRRARAQVDRLRQAIADASSTADLQERLTRLQAPTVPPDQLGRPLPELRRLMLDRLERYSGGLERRLAPPPTGALRDQILEAVRVVVASLGMALAWAAGAEWPNQEGTLLEHWLAALQRPGAAARGTPAGRSGGGRRGAVDEDFFEQLAGREEGDRDRPGPG